MKTFATMMGVLLSNQDASRAVDVEVGGLGVVGQIVSLGLARSERSALHCQNEALSFQ